MFIASCGEEWGHSRNNGEDYSHSIVPGGLLVMS